MITIKEYFIMLNYVDRFVEQGVITNMDKSNDTPNADYGYDDDNY